MAIDRTGITSLDAGAGEITYSGNEGPKSPDQQLMAQADPMIVEMYQQYVFEMEEQGLQPMSFREFLQQALSGMAKGGRAGFKGGGADYMPTDPGPMGNPAVMEKIEDMREFRIANPNIEDVADYKGYYERLKKLQELKRLIQSKGHAYGGSANPTYTQKRKQSLANGGVAGLRKRYLFGKFGDWVGDVKDKFVDDIIPNEIKENPLLSSVVTGALLNQYGVPFTGTPGDRMGQDWFSDLISGPVDKAIQQGVQPLSMHNYDPDIPQIDIIKGPTTQPVISTGTGDSFLSRLTQGAGDVLGGVGDVATKIGQTIIPGGETGYGDIYGGIGSGARALGSGVGSLGELI